MISDSSSILPIIDELINEQLKQIKKTIEELKSTTSSSNEASNVLLSYLR